MIFSDEDSERNHSLTSIYSVSNVTPMSLSEPDDSPAATCSSISTDVSVADNIFDEATEGDAENIEHNMIATRYGLPYDVVQCGCHAEALMQRNRQTGIKLCKTGSCHKFEEQFGELDGRAIRLWHTTKRLNEYKKACRIYKIFMSKPDPTKRKEFLKADYMLKVNFPHYWVHLSEKYITFMTDEDYQRENNYKEEVVESCQRILREQGFFSQHYQVIMRDFGENVKFSVDYRHLHQDFKMACEFLMKEYPNLFQHLMEKFDFGEFARKRLTVDENRKKYIEYSKKSGKVLKELEHAHCHESLAKIKKRNQV
ncbi:uncharacterized protein LOC123321398 [Coccinella septempunctata]|uniref:uncharacterized protein LOC123321398 n=1 Tax=Coccinella septempunctata TaxID=41139 RepID=UPI001D073195|nr:uncharacterized protein LOC123321398 [Coccinella septempunctata]